MGIALLAGGAAMVCGITSYTVTRSVMDNKNEVNDKISRDAIRTLIIEKEKLEKEIRIRKNERCKAIAKKKKECDRIKSQLP